MLRAAFAFPDKVLKLVSPFFTDKSFSARAIFADLAAAVVTAAAIESEDAALGGKPEVPTAFVDLQETKKPNNNTINRLLLNIFFLIDFFI